MLCRFAAETGLHPAARGSFAAFNVLNGVICAPVEHGDLSLVGFESNTVTAVGRTCGQVVAVINVGMIATFILGP